MAAYWFALCLLCLVAGAALLARSGPIRSDAEPDDENEDDPPFDLFSEH